MIRLFLMLAFAIPGLAYAGTDFPVQFQGRVPALSAQQTLTQQLQKIFATENVRSVRAEFSPSTNALIARVFFINVHRFESVRFQLLDDFTLGAMQRHFVESHASDNFTATCPDASVEFISVAPNNDDFEQGIARDVANAAHAAGLNTVQLLGAPATRAAYLNYMSCPNLKGNFYDGDANPSEMVTSDGVINSDDYASTLNNAFRFHVTNIWLACEAFNNPMHDAVIVSAKAQKYAAGINDLEIGPSDNAAACAMKAAISGQPMTAAFQSCYKQLDQATDQWGFAGQGSDQFGQ